MTLLNKQVADSGNKPGGELTVAIATQGCKLNQADSDVLARQFAEAGYRIVDPGAGPQVFILNTCTVTGTADAKARRALRSARRANPQALVVATGCYAQRAPADLEGLEAVSLVVGNFQKDKLVALVSTELGSRGPSANPQPVVESAIGFGVFENARFHRRFDKLNGFKGLRTRANIKIQEGCDQVCAYCIVPKVRGRERSIPAADLVEQINRYTGEGFKEVVLTGTQLGTYGFDLPESSLVGLLRKILDETTAWRLATT